MKKIPLSNSDKFVLVDDEDYPLLSRHNIYSYRDSIFIFVGNKINISLMNLVYPIKIKDIGAGQHLFYKNKNMFDNRKKNIGIAYNGTIRHFAKKSKNKTSKFKGVWWNKQAKKWESRIIIKKRKFFLGNFKNEEEAALAYNKKAKELYGKYAYQNHV